MELHDIIFRKDAGEGGVYLGKCLHCEKQGIGIRHEISENMAKEREHTTAHRKSNMICM